MASCPLCGRSCGCASNYVELDHGFATTCADALAALHRELDRALAASRLRAADKLAARRAELLSPAVLPLPPPRAPKRNRVCSKAEMWRAA